MSGRLSMWVAGVLCTAVCGLVLAGLASANALPDGRIYEQVTPEEKLGGEAYQPPPPAVQGDSDANSETTTEYMFQAAADGRGIAFVAAPGLDGNENQGLNGGNEYLAKRSSAGAWTQIVLSPEEAPSTVFQGFSQDLTIGFANSVEPLSSPAPGFGEPLTFAGSYDVLYSVNTDKDQYVPFFSTKPPYRSIETFGTAGEVNEPAESHNGGYRIRHSHFLALEGASSDSTHLLFAANDALTEASESRPAAEGGSGAEFEHDNNLYESVGGRLRLVNVLPNGTTHANAGFGNGRPLFSRVISADGSRIFWTDLSSGHIYMREDGVKTVEISPQGTYQTATSDGSIVFYTHGALYADEVQSGDTIDLTPGVTVEMVLGTSENGEYVYYVTSNKELKLWHGGVSTQIAQFTPQFTPKRAEVTPDGHSIVFQEEELIGSSETEQRVYTYDADSGTLYCASCGPNGTAPKVEYSNLPMTNKGNVYQPRWISADGSRVFFVSLGGLVPQDTNGVQDVYEWERPGSGECTESTGCVYLLSEGTSTAHSGFLDASENGGDVFIVTRAKLVSGDEDDLFDVYDVRTGSAPPAAPACTGTGCQGVPSPAPIFATPSSVTFEGVGNFATPAKEKKAKPKPKRKSKRKKNKMSKSKARKRARKADGRRRSGSKGGRS